MEAIVESDGLDGPDLRGTAVTEESCGIQGAVAALQAGGGHRIVRSQFRR